MYSSLDWITLAAGRRLIVIPGIGHLNLSISTGLRGGTVTFNSCSLRISDVLALPTIIDDLLNVLLD